MKREIPDHLSDKPDDEENDDENNDDVDINDV